MGLTKYIKKYKTYERGVLSRRAATRKELQKIKTIERKAYFIEAQRQAKLRGTRIAQRKFNKPSLSKSFKKVVKATVRKPVVRKTKIRKRRKYVYY